MQDKKNTTVAVVLAAGQGLRMGSAIPKQFLEIKGKKTIFYALRTFEQSEFVDHVILVTEEKSIEYCQREIVDAYGFQKIRKIVAGGKERYHSVYEGLLASGDLHPDLVMIHDGARPFVSETMIRDSVLTAARYGGCAVGVPVKDTIKVVDAEGFGVDTPERKYLYQVQTPQTFQYEVLLSSYKNMFQHENYKITDDTMLVELYGGVRCKMVPGAYENIKITTPEDLEIAEKFVEKIFEKN